MQQHASSWRETRYSSRLSEQGSRISQPRSDNGRCGWGCFLEWKRRMQRVAFPVVVPLVAPVVSLTVCASSLEVRIGTLFDLLSQSHAPFIITECGIRNPSS